MFSAKFQTSVAFYFGFTTWSCKSTIIILLITFILFSFFFNYCFLDCFFIYFFLQNEEKNITNIDETVENMEVDNEKVSSFISWRMYLYSTKCFRFVQSKIYVPLLRERLSKQVHLLDQRILCLVIYGDCFNIHYFCCYL